MKNIMKGPTMDTELQRIATICTFGFLFLIALKPVPEDNIQLILAISGFVLGYFFGSSNKKTGMTEDKPSIEQLQKGETP